MAKKGGGLLRKMVDTEKKELESKMGIHPAMRGRKMAKKKDWLDESAGIIENLKLPKTGTSLDVTGLDREIPMTNRQLIKAVLPILWKYLDDVYKRKNQPTGEEILAIMRFFRVLETEVLERIKE